MTDTIFAGHIGNGVSELGGVALGNTYKSTSIYLAIGFLSAMDTLVPQAWGAKRNHTVGIIALRGFIWALVLCFPVGWFWFQTEAILLSLNQDPELAHLAGIYMRGLLPGLPALLLYQVLIKYLNNMGKVLPPALTGLASLFVNVFFNWIFIWGIPGTRFAGWGFIGAARSTAMVRWFVVIANLVVIMKWRLHEGTWAGWRWREALEWRGMWEFFKLGVPAGLALAVEVWGWQATTITASYLGAISLDAHIALLSVLGVTFIIPFGFAQAASQRVGSSLGAKDAVAARVAALTALFVATAISVIASISMMVFRSHIARAFSPNGDVQALIKQVMPMCASFLLFDATQAVGQGILRGMGRQHFGLIANLFGYYVIAIPIGVVIAFRMDQGLVGIWIGLLCGLVLLAGLLIHLTVVKPDWKKEVERAASRLKSSGGSGDHVQARTDAWSADLDSSELQLLTASSTKNDAFSINDEDEDDDVVAVEWDLEP